MLLHEVEFQWLVIWYPNPLMVIEKVIILIVLDEGYFYNGMG
jgi:hypothetical protein